MTSTAATLPTSTSIPTRRPSLRTAGIVAGVTALVAGAAVIGLTTHGSGTAQPAPHHAASVARADAAESVHGTGATLSTGTGQAVHGTGFPAVRPDAVTELVHGGAGSLSDAAGRPVRTAP
jgi:hypothetical protein